VLPSGTDTSVLVGFPAAERYLHFDGHPSTIYVRSATRQVTSVDDLLAATANPEDPGQVTVGLPSAALTAQLDANSAFNSLFFGLGAVVLLVGAVGVANIMVISVLERSSEIGLRRALGATKGHIRAQFLAESILLTLAGGLAGVLADAASTAVFAHARHEQAVMPALAWAGGIAAPPVAPSTTLVPGSTGSAAMPPRHCTSALMRPQAHGLH
jgi:putative ABC transport system permease protein